MLNPLVDFVTDLPKKLAAQQKTLDDYAQRGVPQAERGAIIALLAQAAGLKTSGVRLELDGDLVLSLHDVPGVAALTPFRRALRAAGLPAPKTNDLPTLGCRTYVYPNALKLYVYFGGDKPTCQYVKVGEKVEPVYELRCEGGEPTLPAEDASADELEAK
mgnify:CR=1 FL=1